MWVTSFRKTSTFNWLFGVRIAVDVSVELIVNAGTDPWNVDTAIQRAFLVAVPQKLCVADGRIAFPVNKDSLRRQMWRQSRFAQLIGPGIFDPPEGLVSGKI